MSEAEDIDRPSPGLPGDLVRGIAERLQEENSDLREYGYHLALVPEDDTPRKAVPVEEAPSNGGPPHGHWSEVEIQKLPNNDLAIRLRGYTASSGTEQEERTAELVRELLRATLL